MPEIASDGLGKFSEIKSGKEKSGEVRESERIWETKTLQSLAMVLPGMVSDGLEKFSEIKSLERSESRRESGKPNLYKVLPRVLPGIS